jgi:hypothetical protein
MPSDDPRDDARRFIASIEWRFAKTIAHYNPHWYVVERDNAGLEFTAFVTFAGVTTAWKSIAGTTASRMPATAAGSATANEAPMQAGTTPPATRDPRELIWHDVERELISREQAEASIRALAATGGFVPP